jgi:Ribonuclease G/E
MKVGKIFLIVTATSMSALLVFSGCSRKPRFCRDDFPERVLQRIDKRVEKLDLTEKQKLKYNEIRDLISSDINKIRDERKKLMGEINGELNKKEPDMNKIAKILKEKHAMRESYIPKYVDRFVEFYHMLNQEQKALVLERMRRFGDRMSCN